MSDIKSKKIAAFSLGNNTEVRLCINTFGDGTVKPDIRVWYRTAKEPDWKPSPKGLSFPGSMLPDLRKGMRRLEAKLAIEHEDGIGEKTAVTTKPEAPVKVGFWREEKGDGLPVPKAQKKPWEGQKAFLKALYRVEANNSIVKANRYKGYSTCRCCGDDRNGSIEYETRRFIWPEGLAHYVENHNVEMPSDFVKWILKRGGKK